MAGGDESSMAQRIVRALQTVRRGEADVVEIRGSSGDQEVAKVVVADFVEAFEVDVTVHELPNGFSVEVRDPPSRTISIDL